MEILKILYDYENPEVSVEETLTESGESKKKYKIKGVFSTISEKNRNGRIYPHHLWEREVSKYQEHIKSGSINRLCEWEHPSRGTIDPMQAVACIDKLYIQGNKVLGEATILDNEKGNQLKTLIDNGIKISVSSRGTGKVGNNGVVESFNLITYDLVANPSDFNATMEGFITESKESFIIENGELKEVKEEKLTGEKITEIFKNALKENSINEGISLVSIYFNKLKEDFTLLNKTIKKDLPQFASKFKKTETKFNDLINEIDTFIKEF